MMLVFVTLSTDVSRSVIMNLIIEGANCVGCIWCDLVDMCCYDKRVIVHLFVKRKAFILACWMTWWENDAWGPQGQKPDSGLGDSVHLLISLPYGMWREPFVPFTFSEGIFLLHRGFPWPGIVKRSECSIGNNDALRAWVFDVTDLSECIIKLLTYNSRNFTFHPSFYTSRRTWANSLVCFRKMALVISRQVAALYRYVSRYHGRLWIYLFIWH